MSNIRVDVGYTIHDGTEIKFRSPVDCSAITGLIVYYPGSGGNTVSKVFVLADAHGNNVGDIDHLFAEDVVVKVILDVTKGMAFVQNADTNAYLEAALAGKAPDGYGLGGYAKKLIGGNLNDVRVNGWYGWENESTAPANIPFTWGYMVVHSAHYNASCVQIAFAITDSTKTMMRHYSSGTWSDWQNYNPSAFAPSGYGLGAGGKSIAGGDNLNNYTRGGWYQLTKGVANAPTDYGLMLTVPGSAYLSDAYQVVFSRYPENKVYFRQLFEGTWKPWVDCSPSAFAPAGYKTKLWQNANRTSSFAPQTISVNLSGYDEVEVYYCLETGSEFNKHMISSICPVGESLFATFTFGSASATYSRGATTNASGVTFSTGYQSGSASNASLVPYRIFGIKGVK